MQLTPTKHVIVASVMIALATVSPALAQVQEAWVAPFPNGVAGYIASDTAGNVYVTGASRGTLDDYLTIKYSAQGNQLWAARYNGSANRDDSPHAVAVDGGGNVYVTGSSTESGTSTDSTTIKYDSNGNELWVARYDRAGSLDGAQAVAVDNLGNIYVTGSAWGSGLVVDLFTAKYDANGNELWVALYDGPSNDDDIGVAIAVNSDGDVYVSGNSKGTDGRRDYVTLKYDEDGNQLWVARYGATFEDYVSDMVLDSTGNVYVTGGSDAGSSTGTDFATVKYDTDGTRLWVARHHNDWEFARALAGDQAGNVYVTGDSAFLTGELTVEAYLTLKYGPDGNRIWAARYESPPAIKGIAVDKAGGVYVTGASATVKYDTDGHHLWEARGGHAITLDDAGNAHVTGAVTVKFVPVTQFSFPTLRPSRQFQFTLIGEPGRNFEIQSSPDLATWTTFTNFLSATGTNEIVDSVNSSQRFYRAVQLP